jgi:uncharacterized membrane protein
MATKPVPPRPRLPPAPRRVRFSPGAWLAVVIVAYFAVSLVLSWVRALEMSTTTWDLGIYQQALWSTAHGRPFYEAADLETGGFGSLLQVHSVFVLYLLVPLYALAPTPLTMFVVQSAVVALAAVPLYLLARDLTGSSRWALLAGVVYLTYLPVLASNLYDFHAEAFLPVELFAFVLCWSRGRYLAGFAVAGVAFLTMELAPILVFFAALFFLLPDRAGVVRGVRALRRTFSGGDTLARWAAAFRRTLRDRRVVATVGMLATCAVAYLALVVVREQYLATWLGVGAFPSGSSGYVIGATPGALGLSAGNLTAALPQKLLAWWLFFALLGFVPLLAPRALVLSAPWAAFTLFSGNPNYVALGFQYGFIVASGLLVAFAYGLVPLRHWVIARSAESPVAAHPEARSRLLRGPRVRTVVVVGFAVLVAVNVAGTPVNPMLEHDGLGSAYSISISVPPGYAEATSLAGLIPAGSPVLASDNVFPLVANDEQAYSLSWVAAPWLRLPFNATALPKYAFLSESRSPAVPPWLKATLYDPADFGLRGIAWSTPAGTLLLFERGYDGPLAQFGSAPASGGTFFGPQLGPEHAGYIATLAGTAYPSVVASDPGSSGPMWSGPDTGLPAGNYTVTVYLRAWTANVSDPPPSNTRVLALNASAFSETIWSYRSLDYAALAGTGWTPERFSFTISEPVMQFEVRGFALSPAAEVAIEYLSLAPAG